MPKLSEKKKPTPSRKPQYPVERFAFTIPEFCEAHRISQSGYYKIRRLGRGPKEQRALDKLPIITYEAAAEWRKRYTTEPAEEVA